MLHRLALCLFCFGLATAARAALFDDEVARKQIAELKATVEASQAANSRALLELGNQLQALRDEQARLRGQLEAVTYGIEQINKRLQDFYVDLDGRLRKLEPQQASGGDTGKPAAATEPAAAIREYDAAFNLFKAAKYKEAAVALTAFVTNHPASTLAPSAQYWLGNAWYAMGDCKRAIDMQSQLLTKWPASPRAPEAMLAIATCQQELGKPALAKKMLEDLLAQFPEAPAAETARQQLKKK